MPAPIAVPSKNQVDKAGKYLRDLDQPSTRMDLDRVTHALQVVQDFRDAHASPMLGVRMGLQSFIATTSVAGSVSQRHKRVERILRKLRRMRDGASGGSGLYRLEDIGGCRVVLATPRDLERLAAHIRKRWKSQFVRDPRDYIAGPKMMGYRAQHIVVRRGDRAIEIQLRTRGQQEWADQVEQMDARLAPTGFSLKDEDGPPELIDFFSAAGEVIHRREYGLAMDTELVERFNDARRAVVEAGYYTD